MSSLPSSFPQHGHYDAVFGKKEDEKLEPFNLDEEESLGRFDQDGNFIWTRRDRANGEEEEEEDIEWMADSNVLSAKSMKRVEQQRKAVQKRSASLIEDPQSALKQIFAILRPSETVLDALKRLGGDKSIRNIKAKKQSAWQKRREAKRLLKNGMAAPAMNDVKKSQKQTSADVEDAEKFSVLTSSSNFLLASGYMGIFSETRELIKVKYFQA